MDIETFATSAVNDIASPTQGWGALSRLCTLTLSVAAYLLAAPAHALDGCRAVMCFAAPDWSQVQACVPTVKAVFRRLARGKPFPDCDRSEGDAKASNAWTRAPDLCPDQYTEVSADEGATSYRCLYTGVISVRINDKLWTRTWWTPGSSVTEFSKRAKVRLDTWNSQFDDDRKAWLDAQQAAPATCESDC